MKKRGLLIIIPFLTMALALGAVMSARSQAPEATSEPVISKSYADEIFTKDIEKETQNIISLKGGELDKQADDFISNTREKYNSYLLSDDFVNRVMSKVSDEAGEILSENTPFKNVKITKGKTVILEIGSEIILRSGSAVCYSASTPGLICETSGSTLENGKTLIKSTLYISTLENRGITTLSDSAFMIKGKYSFK